MNKNFESVLDATTKQVLNSIKADIVFPETMVMSSFVLPSRYTTHFGKQYKAGDKFIFDHFEYVPADGNFSEYIAAVSTDGNRISIARLVTTIPRPIKNANSDLVKANICALKEYNVWMPNENEEFNSESNPIAKFHKDSNKAQSMERWTVVFSDIPSVLGGLEKGDEITINDICTYGVAGKRKGGTEYEIFRMSNFWIQLKKSA